MAPPASLILMSPQSGRLEGRTIGAVLSEAAAALDAAGFDEPRRRARRLVAAALGLSATEIFAHPEWLLSEAHAAQIADILHRSLAHEPLSRIFGTREFWGLEFRLSADTLDPRPETETVVEAVLARVGDRRRPYRILDLGTGSGCLVLALLSELPSATGIGVDRAVGAAVAARGNAQALGLAGRAGFVVGDWAGAMAGRFDVVVANPPYIATGTIAGLAPEVRDFDPNLALDGGADGLAAYREIAAALPGLLVPGGLFAAELGAGQDAAVASILHNAGLAVDGFVDDLAGIARCVLARPLA
ncbi:MAG TPA: peptide chain release factor N(5)-glutamine methyltransferase [Stellaceae bacterium]|jgi:release factor glutamine methyltransferase